MNRVIRTRKRGYPHEGWSWEHVVEGFEEALIAAGFRQLGNGTPNAYLDFLGRGFGRLGLRAVRCRRGRGRMVLGLMGWKPRLAFPFGYLPLGLVLFVWDCWPIDDAKWERTFRTLHPDLVIFAASDAARRWGPRLGSADCMWLGEAIDPFHYSRGGPLVSRSVDVLEYGRRFEVFTRAASDALGRAGMVHVHPTLDRPHVFANRMELAAGLAESKITVCYPASVTHPDGRANGIETMTHRYLEAVASRSLLVGKIPAEMIELFGFVPGVDLRVEDVRERLPSLVKDIGKYQSLVDSAYDKLHGVATWNVRAAQIRNAIENAC